MSVNRALMDTHPCTSREAVLVVQMSNQITRGAERWSPIPQGWRFSEDVHPKRGARDTTVLALFNAMPPFVTLVNSSARANSWG